MLSILFFLNTKNSGQLDFYTSKVFFFFAIKLCTFHLLVSFLFFLCTRRTFVPKLAEEKFYRSFLDAVFFSPACVNYRPKEKKQQFGNKSIDRSPVCWKKTESNSISSDDSIFPRYFKTFFNVGCRKQNLKLVFKSCIFFPPFRVNTRIMSKNNNSSANL